MNPTTQPVTAAETAQFQNGILSDLQAKITEIHDAFKNSQSYADLEAERDELRAERDAALAHLAGKPRQTAAEAEAAAQDDEPDNTSLALPVSITPETTEALFVGHQDDGKGGKLELWNLLRSIPNHPMMVPGSTYSRATMEMAGLKLPVIKSNA
jgi:hypothetical protein